MRALCRIPEKPSGKRIEGEADMTDETGI